MLRGLFIALLIVLPSLAQLAQAEPLRLSVSPPARTDSTRGLSVDTDGAGGALDPRAIALDYTHVRQPAWDFLRGKTPLDAGFRPTVPWIDLTSRLLRSHARFRPAPTSAVVLASRVGVTRWGVVEEGNVLGRLRRWQRRLALRLGSFSRSLTGQVERWDGLGNPELEDDTGRTFALADDNIHGDVMLMVGRVENSTTLAEVMDGSASLLALNPFREVGVQFDVTLVEGVLPGQAVVVMRTRAAYLGFFEKVGGIADSAGASVESELGLALALKW